MYFNDITPIQKGNYLEINFLICRFPVGNLQKINLNQKTSDGDDDDDDDDGDRSGGERDSVQMGQRNMGKNCYMTG